MKKLALAAVICQLLCTGCNTSISAGYWINLENRQFDHAEPADYE